MKNNLIILSVIVVAVAGIYFLSSGPKSGSQNYLSGETVAVASLNQQNQVMFSIDAKRWQFTPDIIRVKKGQNVKIIINNIDTVHGINLPEFNAIGDDSIEFLADKTGEFSFFCKNFCGEGHSSMTGKIIITD